MTQKMIPLGSLLLVAVLLVALAPAARAQALVPCVITAIDARTGIVSAKVNASGAAFQFRVVAQFGVTDAKLLAGLRVGQTVYANLTTNQVSLDGKKMCCVITSPPQPPANAGAPPATSKPSASRAAVSSQNIAQLRPLPTMSYGTPTPSTFQMAPVSGPLGGPRSSQRSIGGATVAHVHGVDGFEQVQGIPENLKNLLGIHVRALPAGESDHYIINVAQAQEWYRTHHISDQVKPRDGKTGDGHGGCHAVSWHCAQESAKHAEDEVSRQAEIIREQAQADWKHWGTELTKDWHEVEGCLADNTLHLDNIPVQFSKTPQLSINANTQGSTKAGFSGSVSGTLDLATKVDSDLRASVDVFYIPCLPFLVRPKAMGAVGTLGVTPMLTASLDAKGKFDKRFNVPPTGDWHVPVEIIPIIIAGVPVAELDISIHFEGNIEVGADAELTASFHVEDPHQFVIDFICDGHGCGPARGKTPTVNQVRPTTTETYKLVGKAHVKPDIYVALEMNFEFGAATVRIGPQPYLFAQINGCGTATGTTTIGATSTTTTSTESHALVSDLDWGMTLRTEFLVGGTKEGKGWNPVLVGQSHLGFKDLWPGGSNALIPTITGPTQANAGKPAVYNIKMPACYPFTDKVKYSVAWTRGTTKSATTNAQSDPLKNYALNMVWPAAGTYSLTVTASGDTHPGHAPFREFSPPTPTPSTISVTVK
jgi:hypothetical protein